MLPHNSHGFSQTPSQPIHGDPPYLNEIVAGRRKRVAAEGAELGEAVPGSRRQPLVPLLGEQSQALRDTGGDGSRGTGDGGAPAPGDRGAARRRS